MLAAGLGSLYICADLFDMHSRPVAQKQTSAENPDDALPAALRRVDPSGRSGEPKHFRPQQANAGQDPANHGAGPRLDGQELQDR